MNEQQDDFWAERTPGSLIRPYTLTRGRTTQPVHNLDLLTQVRATPDAPRPEKLDAAHAEVVRMCATPCSIAELSAVLGQPLLATKILVGDLIDTGHLVFRIPDSLSPTELDLGMARAILARLKTL